MTIRCDFAGAGGMALGLRRAGYTGRIVCVEQNKHAAATARAAGFEVIEGDVRRVGWAHTGNLLGYTAGPPCQTFSQGGARKGLPHVDSLVTAVGRVANGDNPAVAVEWAEDDALDERTVLALHPLTVIRDERPLFVALEQVKAVRPVWEAYATVMRRWGYTVVVHDLHSEQYGVPQARHRVGLVAVLNVAGEVESARVQEEELSPHATHSRYYPHNPSRLDPGVKRWVTMAEGINRGMTARPSHTVCGGGTATGGAEPFGNGARQAMYREMDEGRWLFSGAGQTSQDRIRQRPRDAATEPAHTITGARSAQWSPVAEVEGDTSWAHERPSPTIVGSFRPDVVAAPGYRKPGDPPRQKTPGSVRVTVQEAGILQSFPADYPWQGPVSAQHQQAGNAVPPDMAAAVTRPLLALTWHDRTNYAREVAQ